MRSARAERQCECEERQAGPRRDGVRMIGEIGLPLFPKSQIVSGLHFLKGVKRLFF